MRYVSTITAVVTILLFSCPARAELSLGLYGGVASTIDSNVKLNQPGGTNLTFRDVSWTDKSFESPYYYGLRVSYWTSNGSNWGGALDFTHAKMHAKLDKTVNVTGNHAGLPVNTSEPLSNTFQNLEFSHGHNLLTLNVIHRWFLGKAGHDSIKCHIQPYVSLGAGIAIPHVEVETGGTETNEYQYVGLALEGIAGVNFVVLKHFSIFTEYKLNYAHMEVDLSGGGTLSLTPWTSHLVFGISVNFF